MNKTVEEVIESIVEKVRYVEFLQGVPVQLPNSTIAVLRGSIRESLTSQRQTLREEIGKMKKGVNLDDDSADFFHITGYNQAIADVLKVIDEI